MLRSTRKFSCRCISSDENLQRNLQRSSFMRGSPFNTSGVIFCEKKKNGKKKKNWHVANCIYKVSICWFLEIFSQAELFFIFVVLSVGYFPVWAKHSVLDSMVRSQRDLVGSCCGWNCKICCTRSIGLYFLTACPCRTPAWPTAL